METTLSLIWEYGVFVFLLVLCWVWALLTPDPSQLTASEWQKFRLANNDARRALGFIPALIVFWLIIPSNPSWIVTGFCILVALLAYALLNPGNFFFPASKKYIKWYRLMPFKGRTSQVMAFAGEASWQFKKIEQGMCWVPIVWNDVAFFSFTECKTDQLLIVRSRIGKPLASDRKTARVMPDTYRSAKELPATFFFERPLAFMEVGGQMGIQRSIITPGYIGPVDLIAFEIDDGELSDSHNKSDKPEDNYYAPYRVPDDKFLMVTCLDAAKQKPEGATFARLGEFDDIEKIIGKNLDVKEIDSKFRKEDLDKNDKIKSVFEEGKESIKERDSLDETQELTAYDQIFRWGAVAERKVAGPCLQKLLEGPPKEVQDYQNVRVFDELGGTMGMHWRLVRPGQLLNLNRFVFDVKLVEPLVVAPGTVEVLILSTGHVARDITQRAFKGGKIVRMGGHGINVKALEPAHYAIAGYKQSEETQQFLTVRRKFKGDDGKDKFENIQIPKIEHVKVGTLATFVTVPTRQLSLFFKSDYPTSVYDADLNTIRERSKDGIWVIFDFNVLMTIPAESGGVIVAAFGDPLEFITRVVATTVFGTTVEYIRTNDVKDIVAGTLKSGDLESVSGDDKTKKHQPVVITKLETALREAIGEKYGVHIDKVKMEHFDAEDYLVKLEQQAVAQAEEKAVIAQTRVVEQKKSLRQKEGEAEANFLKTKAAGEAEAINLTYGALVNQFGQEGAIVIEAIDKMTSGKHPFMPEIVGLSTGDGNATGGLLPAATIFGSAMTKLNKAAERVLNKDDKKPIKEERKVGTKDKVEADAKLSTENIETTSEKKEEPKAVKTEETTKPEIKK